MKLASVILDIPTQALDAPYTYAVPEEGLFAAACEGAGDCDDGPLGRDFAISVGCAVLVPFGHRRAVGFVVSIGEYGQPGGPQWPQGIDAGKLKAIERAVSQPYFDEEGAACAQWLSERYIAPLSACVRLFTPPGGVPRMVHGRDGGWRLEQPAVGQVDDRWVVAGPAFSEFTPRANAVKQVAVMEALRGGQLRVSELAAQLGSVSSTLKALEAKGAVVIEHRRRMRGFSEDVARIAQRAVSGAAGDTAGEEAVGFGEAAGGGVVEGEPPASLPPAKVMRAGCAPTMPTWRWATKTQRMLPRASRSSPGPGAGARRHLLRLRCRRRPRGARRRRHGLGQDRGVSAGYRAGPCARSHGVRARARDLADPADSRALPRPLRRYRGGHAFAHVRR